MNPNARRQRRQRRKERRDPWRNDPNGPPVCPGCYAVGTEPCLPGCIDAEIEEERRAWESQEIEDLLDAIENIPIGTREETRA